jgi:hypothetical protein
MATNKRRKSKLDPYADKLGILPDSAIAELAGVKAESVRRHRHRHGILARWKDQGEPLPIEEPTVAETVLEPAPEPTPEPTPEPARKRRKSKMDPFADKIGVLSDREVAELAGVSAENVRVFRKRRGIPAQWRGEGKPAAAKAAPKVSTKRKPRRGKLTPYLDRIGTTPDARIAEMADTSPANVRAFRLRHDIPARWRGEGEPARAEPATPVLTPDPTPPAPKPSRKPRKGKLSPYLEEIGILTDSVIADRAGTTAQNVRAFRLRHQIPARWRGEGEPLPNEEAILVLHAGTSVDEAPAPVVEPAQAPVDDLPPEPEDLVSPPAPAEAGCGTEALSGYRIAVEVDGEKKAFFVTGKDIVDAAMRAVEGVVSRGIEGEVVEVKFVARMLGT